MALVADHFRVIQITPDVPRPLAVTSCGSAPYTALARVAGLAGGSADAGALTRRSLYCDTSHLDFSPRRPGVAILHEAQQPSTSASSKGMPESSQNL